MLLGMCVNVPTNTNSNLSLSFCSSVPACNSDNNSNGTVSVNDTGLSIERLEQRLHALETENSRMKEILANNPQIQDACKCGVGMGGGGGVGRWRGGVMCSV